jgi:hypothetical protein
MSGHAARIARATAWRDRLMAVQRLVPERSDRLPQRLRASGGSLGEPRRHAVEQKVDRSRHVQGPGGGSGCLCRVPHTGVGVAAGVHRLEIRLTCQRRIERFEPAGGVEHEWRRISPPSERSDPGCLVPDDRRIDCAVIGQPDDQANVFRRMWSHELRPRYVRDRR